MADTSDAGSGPDAAAWLARVAAHPVGRLGTRGPAGGVDLVPFVYAWRAGPGPLGRLVSAVDHKPKRHDRLQRFANVAADPAVTVLVDHYDADWANLWWVRLRGTGREARSEAERAEAVTALVAKYPQYQRQPPAGTVLVIELTALRGWSAS